ncbi:MAG: prepilin peptidase [Candidatus Nealsonbacteria bacterium]
MSLFLSLIVFLFGLAIGSFLNCVLYRLEIKKSFLKSRSFCPKCKHVLGFFDLVPVLSFLCLLGKCRYCKKKISFQYPLVEITVGILFLLYFNLFWLEHLSLSDFVFHIIIACFLVIVFVYDLRHYLILDKVIYPAIGLTLFYQGLMFFLKPEGLNPSVFLSGLGAASFFLAIVLLSRGKWMGVGDIKLALLMGLLLGYPTILVALFFAFLSGAIIGTALILIRKKTFKSEVPFGPFLVAGTFLAFFWGDKIVDWYLNTSFLLI